MTNLESYLYSKHKYLNDRMLLALQRKEFTRATEWRIKANMVFDIFRDVTTLVNLKEASNRTDRERTTKNDRELRETALQRLAKTKEDIVNSKFH